MLKQNASSYNRAFSVSGRRDIDNIEFSPARNNSGLFDACVICGDVSTTDPLQLRIVRNPDNEYFIGILQGKDDYSCLSATETRAALDFLPASPINHFDEAKNMFGPFDAEQANGFLFLADMAARSKDMRAKKFRLEITPLIL